jgi:hypothetical protein
MPMQDWSRVNPGVYHNFHYRWIAAIIDRLNAGLLPPGLVAMAEQVIGGTEPDIVTLQRQFAAAAIANGTGFATLAESPPQPKTRFVIPVEAERYAAKANRVVVRLQLGRVVAVIEIVSPGNKDSRHAIRAFAEKMAHLLYDNVNLLVIDPFAPGPRDPQGMHKAIWDEICEGPFELPPDRPLTLTACQAAPIKTAYVEPFAVGQTVPDMPLLLFNQFYITIPLEATYIFAGEPACGQIGTVACRVAG